MSFNLAFGPIDIFQGLDFSNFMEHLAANNPYLDPNSEEYLAINPIQDSKPDQPIDEYTGILEPERPITDMISGGFPAIPPPGMGNPDPSTGDTPPETAATAPPGIPIEYLIAGITGEPIIAVDPEEAGGPNLPDSGIETLPNTTPSAATSESGQGINSLNNSMVFERMRALARQPRNYKSYIG